MLAEDGGVIFLDFGLMATVEPAIMEALATEFQACLSGDFEALAKVFQGVGFVGTPIKNRDGVDLPYRDATLPNSPRPCAARWNRAGGTARFRALATVLSELSKQWRMFTPPSCSLIRTFLTLEGIAAKVDPDFNIYEISMPWAVKRCSRRSRPRASPAQRPASRARAACRVAVAGHRRPGRESAAAAATAEATAPRRPRRARRRERRGGRRERRRGRRRERRRPAMAALRARCSARPRRGASRVLADVDSTDLARKLVSREGRALRRAAATALAEALAERRAESAPRRACRSSAARRAAPRAPALWRDRVARLLLRRHLQLQRGPDGTA